jgi:biopolymer transport protein ExbD
MSLEFTDLQRRHTPEPELVPILDALTCIIFFLMYTTTFMELTSLTLPPSAVSKVQSTTTADSNPLTPKIFVEVENQKIEMVLKWTGTSPGNIKKSVTRSHAERYSKELEATVAEMVSEFSKKFPNEKTLQLGIAERGTYQELITIMDGIRKSIQDIVLISPDDVKSNKEESNGS